MSEVTSHDFQYFVGCLKRFARLRGPGTIGKIRGMFEPRDDYPFLIRGTFEPRDGYLFLGSRTGLWRHLTPAYAREDSTDILRRVSKVFLCFVEASNHSSN